MTLLGLKSRDIWLAPLLFLCILSCKPIDRQRYPMTGTNRLNLTFVKFHKVGGTTASIAIGNVAARYNWKFCCRARDGCNVCAMHNSLRQTRFGIKNENTDFLITLVR